MEGSYVFRLTVTDDENDTAFDQATITVAPEEVTIAPIVDAGADQNIVLPINSITLNGSGSDPDGGNVTFQWTQVSGPNSATLTDEDSETLTANGLMEGSYVFRLTVTDDENDTAFDELTVIVNSEDIINQAPVARITADPQKGVAPLEVTFEASASSDDSAITSYMWNFGGGSTSSESNVTYIFEDSGQYQVELTVEDADGLTNTAEITITVTDPEAVITEEAAILPEVNPTKNGIAKISLVNQPTDVNVISILLHDSVGQLIQSYQVNDVSTGDGTYEIPVSTLSDGLYYMGVETNTGEKKTFHLLVLN